MKELQSVPKIFTPREFVAKYQLPQLVCIHEAHLQQVNESRPRQISRLLKEPVNKNDKQTAKSILTSLTNSVQQLPKQYLKKADEKIKSHTQLNSKIKNKSNSSLISHQTSTPNQSRTAKNLKSDEDDEIGDEVFSDELIHHQSDEEYRIRFNTNTLASSDSGNASAASSNCSENQYPSNSSPDLKNKNKSNAISQLNNQIKTNSVNEQIKLKNKVNEKKLLDLDQPFLLYKSYSSRQVIAHVLDVNAQESLNTNFQRTGPALLIPETYSGKFFVNFNLLKE